MRRLLLLALVLMPAAAAFFLFQNWSPDSRARLPHREAEDDTSVDDPGVAGFAGTEGRRTFFIRFEEDVVEGELVRWPAWYYWFGAWRKSGAESFVADDVLVVGNPRPTGVDLAGLLVLDVREPIDRRIARLREAALTHTSVSAGRGVFSGSARVERTTAAQLEDGVQARLRRPDDEHATIVTTPSMRVSFDERGIGGVAVEDAFEMRRGDTLVAGAGVALNRGATALRIDRLDRLEAAARGGDRLVLSSGGAFVFHPDLAEGAAVDDPLSAFKLGGGRFELENRVQVRFGELEAAARRVEGRVVDVPRGEGGGAELELRDALLTGDVVARFGGGTLQGERARIDAAGARITALHVDGTPARVAFRDADDGPIFEALCTGGIDVAEAPDGSGHRVRLAQDVEVGATEGVLSDMGARGDLLVVEVGRGPDPRAATAGGPTRPRFERAVLEGDVRGHGDDTVFSGSRLDVRSHWAESGARVEDVAVLSGPAHVEARDVTPEDVERFRVVVDAGTQLELRRSAAPFSPTRIDVRGGADVALFEGTARSGRLTAGEVSLVLLDRAHRQAGERRLQALVARGDVEGSGSDGSRFTGDLLAVKDGGRGIELTGRPARVQLGGGDGRDGVLLAEALVWDEALGVLSARRGVQASMTLPDTVLPGGAGDGAPADRLWTMSCGVLDLGWEGGLIPVESERPETDGRGRLRSLRAREAVVLASEGRRLSAAEVFWDGVARTGWAEGAPVTIEVSGRTGRVEDVESLTARRISFDPEWTLLEDGCRVVTFVAAAPRPQEDARTWERLEVTCDRDVLVRAEAIWFTGATRLRRGEGGSALDLHADRVIARLQAEEKGRAPRLIGLEGLGGVELSWGELRGSGDLLDYDPGAGRIHLRATEGDCLMSRGAYVVRSPALVYDVAARSIQAFDPRAEKKEPAK